MSESAKNRPASQVLEVRANGDAEANGLSESWLQAQEAYWSGANALGIEIFDFMGRRIQAYADAFEALPRCESVGEIVQWEVDFGQATFKAYGDEAARLGVLMLDTANGHAPNENRAA